MENLKIRVNSEDESKDIQINLEQLGFKKSVWGIFVHNSYFIFANCNYYSRDDIENFPECDYKEITLPELRDLVVLKRNDVGDATHSVDGESGSAVMLNGVWYGYNFHDGIWDLWVDDEEYKLRDLKPIEKPMKEYLRKNSDGTYSYIGMVQPENISQNVIEIPEGSETFNYYDRKDNLFFLKGSGEDTMFSNDLNDWDWKKWGDIDFDGVVCLWSRHTQPEELPFIDDEPLLQTEIESELDQVENMRELLTPYTPPLNDQYAEIEKVRQSAWQKQEGGSHYKNLKIQPMQYALENKLDYAQANVVKYVTRHKEKNGKEDLLKAIHNLELMIEFYYGDEK